MKYNDEAYKSELQGGLALFAAGAWLISFDWLPWINIFGVGIEYDTSTFLVFLFPTALTSMLPFLITLFFRSRLRGYRRRSARLGIYIATLEHELGLPGWEQRVWTSRIGYNPFSDAGRKSIVNEIEKERKSWNLRASRKNEDIKSLRSRLQDIDAATYGDADEEPLQENPQKEIYENINLFYANRAVISYFETKMNGFWRNTFLLWTTMQIIAFVVGFYILLYRINFHFHNIFASLPTH